MSDEPLTHWIKQLQVGQGEGAEQLWQEYFSKLVELARQKLIKRERLIADEEDIALSAFKSFCAGVEKGRFPQLDDRDDLWKILVSITLRKTIKVIRDSNRLKRGGQWKQISGDSDYDIIQQIASPEIDPEMATHLTEQFENLLAQLESKELIELATLKMEGYTNAEIAARWNKAERTIERKLAIVRQIWNKHTDVDDTL